MAHVEVYPSPFCPYCFRGKNLLEAKEAADEEIDVMRKPRRRSEMAARANGRTTVPQIFIDGRHIGGSDELAALDRAGALDSLPEKTE